MQTLCCVLILSCYYAVAHSDRWLNYKGLMSNPHKKRHTSHKQITFHLFLWELNSSEWLSGQLTWNSPLQNLSDRSHPAQTTGSIDRPNVRQLMQPIKKKKPETDVLDGGRSRHDWWKKKGVCDSNRKGLCWERSLEHNVGLSYEKCDWWKHRNVQATHTHTQTAELQSSLVSVYNSILSCCMCLTNAYQVLGYDNDNSKHLIHKQTWALFLRYQMVWACSELSRSRFVTSFSPK